MKFDEFKVIVNIKKKESPMIFGLEPDTKAHDLSILHAEEKMGLKLPEEYIDFVKEYGGGIFGFGNLYSLDSASALFLIANNKEKKLINSGYLIISENYSGDFYGFKIDEDNKCSPEIYFYDHEVSSWSQTEYVNLFEFLVDISLGAR